MRITTESPVEFATGIASAVLSAITFVVVLWSIGGALSFDLVGTSITIPGFSWSPRCCMRSSPAAPWSSSAGGSVRASEGKNQAEAEYRYALTRLRENGESIALLGGEQEERTGLDNSLRAVLRRWREICFQQMRTTIVYQGSNIIAPVLPVILCAPELEVFHERKLVLEARPGGARLVRDEDLEPAPRKRRRFRWRWRGRSRREEVRDSPTGAR